MLSAPAVVVPYASSGYVAALSVFVVIIIVIVGVIRVLDVRAKRSADPGGDAGAVAGSRYRVFLARFRSRARFVLTLDVEGADPNGEVVTASADPTMGLRVSVGVTNASKADAGETTMKVLVPRTCDVQWIDAGTTVRPKRTNELLGVGERQIKATCFTKVLSRVGPRDNPVATLTVTVPVPPRGEGAADIPIRFRAFADELGVGEDPVIDRVFSVRRS